MVYLLEAWECVIKCYYALLPCNYFFLRPSIVTLPPYTELFIVYL